MGKLEAGNQLIAGAFFHSSFRLSQKEWIEKSQTSIVELEGFVLILRVRRVA